MSQYGSNELKYLVVKGWGELPPGWDFGRVIGVAVDSSDKIYVFNRGEHPMIIFNREGEFLNSWGEGEFKSPHGLYIDVKDNVYCTDTSSHTVKKFTTDGALLQTWGTLDQPGENGAPFNRPTNVALAPSGDLYVSDGYVNARIHRYSPEGDIIQSWGSPGAGIGQFEIPHDIWVYKDGRVFVVDRQNNRIQIFTPDGEYIEQWMGFKRPCSIYIDKRNLIYITELHARMSILDIEGNVISRWGGEESKTPGLFIAPHCAWVDSHEDLYVGETLEGKRIQKFEKIAC
jgi:DNA-binding beta-propeller fold protein YncE